MDSSAILAVALWVVASALAAFLAALDTATKHRDPGTALKTREWWVLWVVNLIVAFVVIYGAYLTNRLDLSFFGFVAAVFGYPLLLHTRLFTIRGAKPEDDKSVGPEFLLQLADNLLLPGIEESIQEQSARLIKQWRQTDIQKLGPTTKDYLASHAWPPDHPRTREQTLHWVEQLLADATANPANADDNARALFIEIEKIGGLRGIRWILKQSQPSVS